MILASKPLALVFEDDPPVRFVLEEALVGMGLRVQPCMSLAELMRCAREEHAAVVLTDFWGANQMSLGLMDRRLLARLGKLAPTIVLSGRAWTRDETAESLGVVRLLRKPFDIDELEAAVQNILRSAAQTSGDACEP